MLATLNMNNIKHNNYCTLHVFFFLSALDHINHKYCHRTEGCYAVTGMKLTAGHRQKSIHIARLAVHFTTQSVIMAEQEICMHLQYLNYYTMCKKH